MGVLRSSCLRSAILLLLAEIITAQVCQSNCNLRGHWDGSIQKCVCKSPYYGTDCLYQRCPFGTDWFGIPVGDDIRNVTLVQCSNMGTCNRNTGKCKCRENFEGRACERLKCASSRLVFESASVVTKASANAVCSGHGRCMLIGDAVKLINNKLSYENWDAKKISGCKCDSGWGGYDCSQRLCSTGYDPLEMSPTVVSNANKNEQNVYILECMATSGYFSIHLFDRYTYPIPYDANLELLKFTLESLQNGVSVYFLSNNARICGDTEIIRTEFILYNSPIPHHQTNMFLVSSTAASRVWSNSTQPLQYEGSSDNIILRFVAEYVITCPICTSCSGNIAFRYGISISDPINILTAGATSSILSAITTLLDLKNDWPQLSMNVTIINDNALDQICDAGSTSTTKIHFYSNYAMMTIQSLSIIDSTNIVSTSHTFSSNIRIPVKYECSNQGICDRSMGICNCNQHHGVVVSSSNGFGAIGNQGDCGYIKQSTLNCGLYSKCSNHGICDDTTGLCQCQKGWSGYDCGIGSCPTGISWFPTSADTTASSTTTTATSLADPHAMSECSNMGVCDRTIGRCICRNGFAGSACEYFDCSRDDHGTACNNHGTCMSIKDYYELFGYTYNGWEKNSFFSCVCDTNYPLLSTTSNSNNDYDSPLSYNPQHPLKGPNSVVSGFTARAPSLSGYYSYDCSERYN